MKKGALSILSELYKQLGSSVLELVDLFELPELQLKHIREELNSIQFVLILIVIVDMIQVTRESIKVSPKWMIRIV